MIAKAQAPEGMRGPEVLSKSAGWTASLNRGFQPAVDGRALPTARGVSAPSTGALAPTARLVEVESISSGNLVAG